MKTAEIDTTAGRYNIYLNIHKALRTFMSETLVTVGRVNPSGGTGTWGRSSDLMSVRYFDTITP